MKILPSSSRIKTRRRLDVRECLLLISPVLGAAVCAQTGTPDDAGENRRQTPPGPRVALLGNPKAADGPPPTLLRFNSEYVGQSSLGEGGAKASFYQVGMLTEIPFPIAGPLTGALGLGIENRGYSFRDFSTFIPGVRDPLENAVAARVAPSLSYGLNDKWRLFAGGSWLYTGAYGSAVRDATMWGGAAGAIYQVTPSFTLVGGFSFTERLDASTLYVPILGFNWQINDRWGVIAGDVATTINGPTLGLQITYSVSDRWKLFGLGGYEDTYTRLGEVGALREGVFRYQSGAVLVGFEWQAAPALVLRLYGGANLAQDYTFRDRDRVELGSDHTGNSPAAGLVLRIKF